MKREIRAIAILLLISLILSSFAYFPEKNKFSSPSLAIDFATSDSVYIDIANNSAFIDYGWLGSGTEIDPFVLQYQTLGHYGDYSYLLIHSTDAHFVIRHCHLILMDFVFWSLSNGRIEDCQFTNSSVNLDETVDCTITDNIFSNSTFNDEQIRITRSRHCEITQNSFSDGFTGILLDNSNDTIISDNRFTDFKFGGISGDLANTTLINNELIRTGIRLEYWSTRLAQNLPTLENNTVNGKEPGIFFNLVGAYLEIEQYGQIILGNCNDTTISGGSFINCATGVQIAECYNCTLDSISVSDCTWNSINIERCPNTTISDCFVINCSEIAIFLSQSPFYTIDNCTLRDNLEGILPHIYSNNGTVVRCTILGKSHVFYGNGINLSNNSTAIGNTISENYRGIFVYGAHCLIVNNTITRNGYGIVIGDAYTGYSENPYANRIYGNEIGWNYFGNAYDNSWLDNEWDDGISIGNCWSDYYGIGYYVISRDAVDHFPRLLPIDGIPLFYIHLGIVLASTVAIIAILVIVMKRRVNAPE
ncbi:hypothetical protein EU528_09775 [Candidatus Thorarchaeota archaeon]|nr:MAG: hypothetical protein EU528_09775 [Candidatus Thorarchaeota archaeon]